MSARPWTPDEDEAIGRYAGTASRFGRALPWLARDLGRHRAECRRRRRSMRRAARRALGLGGGRS